MAKGGYRFGAGRPGTRRRAEACLRLDVRELARRRVLDGASTSWCWTSNQTGEQVGSVSLSAVNDCLVIRYSANGLPVSQALRLERTSCRFGGSRPWLLCDRCSRRVAVVFFGSGRFACRSCNRVAYSSQSEDVTGRTWRRQAKLEGLLGEDWSRPRGMRAATHRRIIDAIQRCEERREAELGRLLCASGLLDWL